MNEEQIIATIKEAFESASAGYDSGALRFFSTSAKHLAGCLDLCGDEQVIDVATGTGHAALAIAGRLPGGRVVGVDFAPGMLERARGKATSMGLKNVEFREGDMRALGFPPGSFDAVVCSFGIFFVNDMDAQLSEIVRVVKPGGRVAITSFADGQFLPLREMMQERLAVYGVAPSPQTWRRIATEPGCQALFEQAGLEHVRVEQKNVGYYLDDAEQWWDVIWNAGFRRLVTQLSDGDLKQFKQEHLQEISALKTADGIWLNSPVLFTIGSKRAS